MPGLGVEVFDEVFDADEAFFLWRLLECEKGVWDLVRRVEEGWESGLRS